MGGSFDLRDLQRTLDDRRSGATEVESALRSELARIASGRPAAVEAALQAAEEAVGARFPAMASLVRLVDEACAAWRRGGAEGLLRALAADGGEAPGAALAGRLAELGRPDRILTLSRSGTVLDALGAVVPGWRSTPGERSAAASHSLPEVLVGEGRPEGEGVAMAHDLAALGYPAAVVVDAALPALAAGAPAPEAASAPGRDLVLLGCDAVGPGGFVNKVGSYALARAAVERGVAVVVLAHPRKLLPVDLPLPCEREPGVGEAPPRLRFDFERVPIDCLTLCLLEDAALDPAALRRRIGSLPPPGGALLRRLAAT